LPTKVKARDITFINDYPSTSPILSYIKLEFLYKLKWLKTCCAETTRGDITEETNMHFSLL